MSTTNCVCYPDVLSLLESVEDGKELADNIGYSKEKFSDIKKKFHVEYMELERSRMIAKSDNENSLEFYQDEQRRFNKMLKVIKEAEVIIYGNN